MWSLITLWILLCNYLYGHEILPYNLPVLPKTTPHQNKTSEKLIPRYLWIAVTEIEKESDMNYHLPALFKRNSNWDIRMVDNHNKDIFMNETFFNTSLLWAYHQISSGAGVAKADIWRYAVLWTYGGMYIDDDSDMKVPLDNMIEPLDQLVISKERNIFNGDMCYIPKYHLSDQATYKNNETRRSMNIFNSAVIPNWALASAPKHPILARTMENIVEVLKHEYIRDPVIRDLRHGYRWMCVMCSTGPSMLTASAREVVFENPPNLVYKLVATDFRDYGGKFKAVQTRQDSKHYTKQFQSGKISLLSSYLPEPPVTPEMLKEWDGEAIKSHSSKEIFLIKDGYRRGFPDFDTFIGMNYTTSNVRVITHTKLEKIPLGEPLLKIQ